MAAPKYEIIQTTYQNPNATDGLKLSLVVVSNTPEEVLINNVRENSEKYENWLQLKNPHDGIAVLIGGGWSANNHIEDIKSLQEKGAKIITMNGSSQWAVKNGIRPDWQVIVDAKEETAELVYEVDQHFFASQCNPKTTARAKNLTLVHFGLNEIEQYLPAERVKQGGYVLLGCGTTVGNAAISVAYSQGYRELHLFGYDSSYHKGKSHAYEQPINQFMPTTEITWAGKTYECSVAMKSQAEGFLLNAKALENAGCKLHVYGEGLLQTIYRTKFEDLSEREKYQVMWRIPAYREVSPGERNAEYFVNTFKPEGLVIDYGCGTGRASMVFDKHGLEVLLLDFADNCRDAEAQRLPFIQHDLTQSCPVKSKYGYCSDVMEHLPEKDVGTVIDNIMSASEYVFFQISTTEDHFGQLINTHLHLTVKPHSWWKELFLSHGYKIEWEVEQEYAALFYIHKESQ